MKMLFMPDRNIIPDVATVSPHLPNKKAVVPMAAEFCSKVVTAETHPHSSDQPTSPELEGKECSCQSGSNLNGDVCTKSKYSEATPDESLLNLDVSVFHDPDGRHHEQLDPRVEERIIMVSDAATTLNQLQTQIRASELHHAETQLAVTGNLEILAIALGRCVVEAAPYYDAGERLKIGESQLRQATLKYASAQCRLLFIKANLNRLEEDLIRGGTQDADAMNMLNAQTNNYAECHLEMVQQELEHAHISAAYAGVSEERRNLKRVLRKEIEDAQRYYDLRQRMESALAENLLQVTKLEMAIWQAKEIHENAVIDLGDISRQIHDRRLLIPNESSEDFFVHRLSEKEN